MPRRLANWDFVNMSRNVHTNAHTEIFIYEISEAVETAEMVEWCAFRVYSVHSCPGLYNTIRYILRSGVQRFWTLQSVTGLCNFPSRVLWEVKSSLYKISFRTPAPLPIRGLPGRLPRCVQLSCTSPTWPHIPAANGFTVCFAIWGEVEFLTGKPQASFCPLLPWPGLTDTHTWGLGEGT